MESGSEDTTSVLIVRVDFIIFGMPISHQQTFFRTNRVESLEALIRTIPLPRNLIPRIAITPRIIVDCFFGVHHHVLFTRAARVQVTYRLHDFLALRVELNGLLGVRLVVDACGAVLGGVGILGKGDGVGPDFVLFFERGGARFVAGFSCYWDGHFEHGLVCWGVGERVVEIVKSVLCNVM
jgi:hypothetical protein